MPVVCKHDIIQLLLLLSQSPFTVCCIPHSLALKLHAFVAFRCLRGVEVSQSSLRREDNLDASAQPLRAGNRFVIN
uniref:Putative secreted protein n=1 Tax=Anopheles darlingi TaxID=43151 RepID=A0A2M4D4P5_ANODA